MTRYNQTESFMGVVKKVGGSLAVTIPVEHCKFSGVEINTHLKIWYKVIKK